MKTMLVSDNKVMATRPLAGHRHTDVVGVMLGIDHQGPMQPAAVVFIEM